MRGRGGDQRDRAGHACAEQTALYYVGNALDHRSIPCFQARGSRKTAVAASPGFALFRRGTGDRGVYLQRVGTGSGPE